MTGKELADARLALGRPVVRQRELARRATKLGVRVSPDTIIDFELGRSLQLAPEVIEGLQLAIEDIRKERREAVAA